MCVCVCVCVQVSYVMMIVICREYVNLDSIWDVCCLNVGGQKFCAEVVCFFLCSRVCSLARSHERERENTA